MSVTPDDPSVNDFAVIQGSHVQGLQSTNRGEPGTEEWAARYFSLHFPERPLDLYTDSAFAVRIVQAIASRTLTSRDFHMAHYDLIRSLKQSWHPEIYNIHQVKSHRDKSEATCLRDLYGILGNDLADETAKLLNHQDIDAMHTAVSHIHSHSQCQMHILFLIYSYMADLNQLHVSLRLSEPDSAAENHQFNNVDALQSFGNKLSHWQLSSPTWQVTHTLLPVVARACNAGAQIAHMVWRSFASLKWRHPDAPNTPGDFGITWQFISSYFPVKAFHFGYIYIYDPKTKLHKPYEFDSPEASIQPKSAHALCHQASTLRGIVRYLEGTMQCHLFPRYKKTTCASSLGRLGFHPTLVGGMAARPESPHSDIAIKLLAEYSALPEQPYPLNVRLPFSVCRDFAQSFPDIPTEPTFSARHNLYQKVRKHIRLKKSLDELVVD